MLTMKVWVLWVIFSPSLSPASMAVIDNIASEQECQRVRVMLKLDEHHIHPVCIEVEKAYSPSLLPTPKK